MEEDGQDCTGRLPGGLPEPGRARKGPFIRTIPACVKAYMSEADSTHRRRCELRHI